MGDRTACTESLSELPLPRVRDAIDPALRPITIPEANQILSAHSVWVETNGISGCRGDFFSCQLVLFDFNELTLSAARFEWADLRGASFRRAILRASWFYNADIRSVDFFSANLTAATLISAQCDGASFEHADLSRSRFWYASLREVSFVGANLTHSDFQGANAGNLNLSSAILNDADLSGLSLGQHQLRGATGNIKTRISKNLWIMNSDDPETILISTGISMEISKPFKCKTNVTV